MNALLESRNITEMNCGSNFAYILDDSASFSTTEYKVLQSKSTKGFVRCMKMLYNGKTQLFYLTRDTKAFSAMLPKLDAEGFCAIVGNLLSGVLRVQNNGFLSCQNVDASFEHIYVDTNTYEVYLTYVPLTKKLYDDKFAFESDLRSSLVKVLSSISTGQSAKTMKLLSALTNGAVTLEMLCAMLKDSAAAEGEGEAADKRNGSGANGPHGERGTKQLAGELCLVTLNAPTRLEIKVTKDDFVLGKKPGVCDGILSFNNMISRVHCRIVRKGERYMIVDLQSANGTFVNKVRLQPNQPCPIKHADIVRLANSDFRIVIK